MREFFFDKFQVTNTVAAGGGGVNTTDVKWAIGELEWSTLMVVLDRAVCIYFFSELLTPSDRIE